MINSLHGCWARLVRLHTSQRKQIDRRWRLHMPLLKEDRSSFSQAVEDAGGVIATDVPWLAHMMKLGYIHRNERGNLAMSKAKVLQDGRAGDVSQEWKDENGAYIEGVVRELTNPLAERVANLSQRVVQSEALEQGLDQLRELRSEIEKVKKELAELTRQK